MATNKNITMKQFNGTDYDTLYPKTIAAQIPDVFSQSETVNAEMLSKYGLGASGTPNDVFGVLSRFQNGLGNEYVWAKSDDTGIIGYVNSPNPSAYPPAVSDGYTYASLGQLGSVSHIEVISYVGTGTVGSSNPTSLTFKIPPKLFLIQTGASNIAYTNFLIAKNVTKGNSISGSSYYSNNITWSNFGKTVSWYCTGGWGGLSSISADAQGQMNSSGVTYTVIAFE